MALSLKPYTNNIRVELSKAFCIQSFPCQNVERHNKPEIEFRDNPELLLPPVTIARSEKERCLVEASINSVRVSLRIGQMDMLEEELVAFIEEMDAEISSMKLAVNSRGRAVATEFLRSLAF
ncbi:hypothetical protein Vafri_6395 [Volvox africanus]|uniref:Actin-related protein 2/3 complex subunit 4 n=1 Tax=Volvox africanus TaxID=51714 RepID=A0A8J4B2H7_9CHLO|nr:hypothetical protein Vafri_6395 [Volvox africanus]